MMTKRIDIIIPVYNALEDLRLCLTSVYRYTDLNLHQVILVNDNSSDPHVRTFLDGEKSTKQNVNVIHNNVNKGFSANINIGMAQSDDCDVILLNSDTIVTEGWVDRLYRCAYSAEEIATVTPLSNNATVCSVPEFCRENGLPEGFTVDGMGKLVESCSLNRYPNIQVAVGFCMFIKRDVIKRIGGFDADTFEKGYGEENDFCGRAAQYGLKNVMCDNTYVFHSGSKSFMSREKQRYMAEHEKILEDRYPLQKQELRRQVQENPNRLIQENIKQYLRLKNGRKNILYLLQADFREDASDAVGGIQLHVKDLKEDLKSDFNIFVAARDGSVLRLTIYIDDAEYCYKFFIGNKSSYPVFSDAGLKKVYQDILNAFQIDIVHIHHTLDLSLELYYAASQLKLPLFTTLHDYYMICPTVKLLDAEDRICYRDDYKEDCRKCLRRKLGMSQTEGYLQYYRDKYKNALLLNHEIFVPSESTKKTFLKYYPELEDRIRLIDHGVNCLKPTAVRKPRDGKPFSVAFIGGINQYKGSRLVCDVIKNGPADIQWYIMGAVGDRELSYLKKKNLVRTGSYEREQLPDLLEKYGIDLICILSVMPETYCYTLSEAASNRIPVLVSDAGALGERVRAMECGWVLSAKPDTQEVLKALYKLKNRGEEYRKVWERVANISLKSSEEMCREYKQIYAEAFDYKIEYGQFDAKSIFNAYLYGKNKMEGLYSEWDMEVLERMDAAEGRLQAIYNSVTYKLAKYLSKLRIPGKNRLKTIAYRIYKRNG